VYMSIYLNIILKIYILKNKTKVVIKIKLIIKKKCKSVFVRLKRADVSVRAPRKAQEC